MSIILLGNGVTNYKYKDLPMKDKLTIQLVLACVMAVAGLVLLFCGFWVAPEGQIHDSVLVAFGEVMTFVGALLGVDYSYKFKIWRNRQHNGSQEEK